MKLAIIGRTELLYDSAVKLSKKHNIELIVTADSRPEYLRHPKDFEKLSKELGAEYIFTKNINDETIISKIMEKELDLGVSINWINIVKQQVIDAFKFGILNAHCGDLPRYRGNACPNWAIINNEDKIVLSIHYMEGDKLDSGDIVGQSEIQINDYTYIEDVYKWLRKETPLLYVKVVNKLQEEPGYILKNQKDDPRPPLRCYPRIPADGYINWNNSAENIHRLIRASSRPLPGAFTYYNSKKLVIWKAKVERNKKECLGVPGQVTSINRDGSVNILTGSGKIRIKEISCEKYKQVAPAEVIKGIRTRLGVNLERLIEKYIREKEGKFL